MEQERKALLRPCTREDQNLTARVPGRGSSLRSVPGCPAETGRPEWTGGGDPVCPRLSGRIRAAQR